MYQVGVLVLGLVTIACGLIYYLGARSGLPRGPYEQDEQKRKAVRQTAPILVGLGLIVTTLGVLNYFGWFRLNP